MRVAVYSIPDYCSVVCCSGICCAVVGVIYTTLNSLLCMDGSCVIVMCMLYMIHFCCCELQESSYCYWPEDEGEDVVSGRLRVKLVRVRGHGDITERKLEVTECDSVSTNPLTIRMIQLTSWPIQGLPHPSAIMSLIDKLNRVLMRSSSKQTVVMCR